MKLLFLIVQFFFTISLLLMSISCNEIDKNDIEGDPFPQPASYHSPSELISALNQINITYSSITRIYTIGYSTEGKPISVFIITDNPDTNEIDEPKIRLSGSIHGNEYVSGEILVRFIEYITENYNPSQPDDTITKLINNRYIAVIPMINPDGVEAGTRNNSNGVDLNRNFSYAWTDGYDHGAYPFSESESAAVKNYSLETVFHLSATYHSGTAIVNMPFDYGRESDGVIPVEYDLVKYLGKIYSTSGTFLQNPDLMSSIYVDSGTINGGDWYIVNGSLQDWSYMESGCLDFTIEVADTSPSTEEGIDEVFLYNRDSIIAFIDAAGIGVYGKVTDSGNNPIVGARVYVNDGSIDGDLRIFSDIDGYYYKILQTGNYTVKFSASGYQPYEEAVTISGAVPAFRLDAQLAPE